MRNLASTLGFYPDIDGLNVFIFKEFTQKIFLKSSLFIELFCLVTFLQMLHYLVCSKPFQYLQEQLLCPRFNCPPPAGPPGRPGAGCLPCHYIHYSGKGYTTHERLKINFLQLYFLHFSHFKSGFTLSLLSEVLVGSFYLSLYHVLSFIVCVGGGPALVTTGVRFGLVNCSYLSLGIACRSIYLYNRALQTS